MSTKGRRVSFGTSYESVGLSVLKQLATGREATTEIRENGMMEAETLMPTIANTMVCLRKIVKSHVESK